MTFRLNKKAGGVIWLNNEPLLFDVTSATEWAELWSVHRGDTFHHKGGMPILIDKENPDICIITESNSKESDNVDKSFPNYNILLV